MRYPAGALTETNNEEIGFSGSGSFTQTGGTNTAGNVVIASQASGSGVYQLNGGTLITKSVAGGAGTSTFDFNGGSLQASASGTTFLQGLGSLLVQAGGGTINTAGFNVTAAQNLLHDSALGSTADGGIVKSGAGILTITGASTYTGPTTVTAGTLRTTTGTLGAGPLVINGATTSVNLGTNQTVSSLSGSAPATASLNVAAGTTLIVNQLSNTTLAAKLIDSGTFNKGGAGTLELDAPPTLNTGSTVQLQTGGGTLRFNLATGAGAPTIGSNVTVSVGSGATLELAGTASALSAGANRAQIDNISHPATGGVFVSGTQQQVGGIDGSGGSVVLAANASLTVNHINQASLVIGNGATFTIAASDSLGNPSAAAAALLGDTSAQSLVSATQAAIPAADATAGAAGSAALLGLIADGAAAAPGPAPTLSADSSAPFTAGGSMGTPLGLAATADVITVPEPTSFMLAAISAGVLLARAYRRKAKRM